MEKNIHAKYKTFRREKWEKYILPDSKMYVKYTLRIYFVFIEKIYFNYTTFSQLYICKFSINKKYNLKF